MYFAGVGPSFLRSDFTEWGSIGKILGENAGDLDFRFLLIGYILFLGLLGAVGLWGLKNVRGFLPTFAKSFGGRGRSLKEKNWIVFLFPLIFLPFFAYRFIPLAIIVMSIVIVYLWKGIITQENTGSIRENTGSVPTSSVKAVTRPMWKSLGILGVITILSLTRFSFYKPVVTAADNKIPIRNEAIGFIRDNDLKGNIFNPLEDGGYLIWKMPERKVFIDQRLDVYTTSGIYDEYKKVYSYPPEKDWEDILNIYDVEIVLLSGWQEEPMKTIKKSGRYDLVYWSDYFFILIKNTGENFEFAGNNKITNLIPFKKDDYDSGTIASAIDESQRLTERSPISANPLISQGVMYQQIKDTKKAIEAFSKALEINPKDNSVRLYLASSYIEDKECKLAIREYQEVEKKGGGTTKAVALLNSAITYKDCLGDLGAAYSYFAKFARLARKIGYDPKAIQESYLQMQNLQGMMK